MTKVVDAVVDSEIAVDNQKKIIGGRLKEARAALELTQKELVVESGIPLPSLRDYELGNRIPGGDAVASLVRAGINANWLLTGDGTMLLADLQAPAAPPAAQVNGELLQEVIDMFYEVLAENKDHVRLDRSCHGAVIALLYKVALSSNHSSKEDVRQVLALAA